jgi:hypothetical protein
MAMDLTVTGYDTYEDLLGCMDGSAAAIGTMMLPILGTDDPAAEFGVTPGDLRAKRATEPVRALIAFEGEGPSSGGPTDLLHRRRLRSA